MKVNGRTPPSARGGGTGWFARWPASVGVVIALWCLLLAGCGGALAAPRAHGGNASSTTTRVPTQAAGIVASPIATTGCGQPPPTAPGTSADFHLSSSGLTRTYRLRVPRGYQPGALTPLVLNFHGHGSSAASQERYTGFSQLADANGFLVVYPQGVVGPDHHTGWASGGPREPRINDVLFVSQLISHLQATLCVDPRRIYATGFSNGGGMTSVLACRMALRIAAFAPVSGSYFPLAGGCQPGRAVPILEFHGTADNVVPYAGRPAIHLLSVSTWLAQWAARDGCARQPSTFRDQADVIRLSWTDCAAGGAIIHYRLIGGIHAWPGGLASQAPVRGPRTRRRGPVVPPVDRTLNASALIWRFFVAHPLPWPATAHPLARAAERRAA